MDSSEVKVSVMMVTYNHEKYLEQAILSVLNQNVDFKYELLIGEDCSTDHTRKIAIRYHQLYPEIIRLTLHNKNVGALKNEADLRRKCRGQYIAVLEGDDYWTNMDKLKSQVEFLDAHPKYIGVTHNVEVLDENGEKLPFSLEGIHHQKEHIYTKTDALDFKMIGHLSGWMYRNIWKSISGKEFELIKKCAVNSDVKLSVILGYKGNVYFMEDTWSVYRRRMVGDGWSATHNNRNLELYYYELNVRLRDLLEQCYNKKVDIQNKLLEHVYKSWLICVQTPSKENIRILFRLLCKKDVSKKNICSYFLEQQLYRKGRK